MVRQICGESTDSNSAELGSGWSLQTRCLSDGVGKCFDLWAESAQVQQKNQLRTHHKKHHHSSWRSIDTITHRTGWTATAVPFSSFPTASRQRFADGSRLPLDRTLRIWGVFCAFCYFETCVCVKLHWQDSGYSNLVQLGSIFGLVWRLSSQHSIWCQLVLDFWSGLAISGSSFLIWLFVCVNLI